MNRSGYLSILYIIATIILKGVNGDSESDEKIRSRNNSIKIAYIVLPILIGLLLILIVVLLIWLRKQSSKSRSRSVTTRSPSQIAMNTAPRPVERRQIEIPNVDSSSLLVPLTELSQHIESLNEPIDYPDGDGFLVEYNYVEKKTAHHNATGDYASALVSHNVAKNRYKNILPTEHSRVKLTIIENEEGSDYINANFISGLIDGSERAYIASQGPVQNTISHFWRMIWELNTSVILNLTREIEAGRIKCERYWPQSKDNKFETTNFEISLKKITEDDEGVITRLFRIKNLKTGEKRKVVQFHYIEWPDQSVPDSTTAYLELSDLVDDNNITKGPIVVHCSAGVGRTGTFCTVHSILELVKEKKKENALTGVKINIAETIINIREQRSNMVQTKEQYKFCYLAIRDGVETILHDKTGRARASSESTKRIIDESESESESENESEVKKSQHKEKNIEIIMKSDDDEQDIIGSMEVENSPDKKEKKKKRRSSIKKKEKKEKSGSKMEFLPKDAESDSS